MYNSYPLCIGYNYPTMYDNKRCVTKVLQMQSRASSVEHVRLCGGSLFSKHVQDMGSSDRVHIVTHI